MKTINLVSTAATVLVVLACVTLMSFAPLPGGDSYEVFLNDELIKKEYLYGRKEAPTIPLSMTTAQDVLSITYSECGKIGTSRKVSLKNESDITLKEWTFADSPDIRNKMRIKATEISAFASKHATAKLVYSSDAAKNGVHLVTLQLLGAAAAR